MYAKNSMSLFRFGTYISAKNPTTMMRRILQRIQRELYKSLLMRTNANFSSSLLRICVYAQKIQRWKTFVMRGTL